MAHQIKSLLLSRPNLPSLLQHGFNPGPRKLPHDMGAAKKKKKRTIILPLRDNYHKPTIPWYLYVTSTALSSWENQYTHTFYISKHER